MNGNITKTHFHILSYMISNTQVEIVQTLKRCGVQMPEDQNNILKQVQTDVGTHVRKMYRALVDIIGAREIFAIFLVLRGQMTGNAQAEWTVKSVLILFVVGFKVKFRYCDLVETDIINMAKVSRHF